MKVWQSYGAEHSLNLVIIGHFKEPSDAEEYKDLVEQVTDFLREQSDFDVEADRFSEEVHDYLISKNISSLSPEQLGQLLYEYSIEVAGNDVHIYSDDELNGLVSLMLRKGAKIEIFSAHDYPESNE